MRRSGVAVFESSELSLEEFLENYLDTNTPVIIKGCIDSWKCKKEWILESGSVNVLLMREMFGGGEVPVVDCG